METLTRCHWYKWPRADSWGNQRIFRTYAINERTPSVCDHLNKTFQNVVHESWQHSIKVNKQNNI